MTIFRNCNQLDISNVIFQDGELLRYDKHNRTPEMEYIDYGAAILNRDVLEQLPNDQPSDLASLYSRLVAKRLMIGYEIQQRFYEIGSPTGLAEADRYLSTLHTSTQVQH
jgi:NDP-sugar pyrophosphorylase family protein